MKIAVAALSLSSTAILMVRATKNVERALRMEFVQKMEEVTIQGNQFSYIPTRELFAAATPMSAPAFTKPRILDQAEEAAGDDAVEDDGAVNDADGDDGAANDANGDDSVTVANDDTNGDDGAANDDANEDEGGDAAGDDGAQEENQTVYAIDLENYAMKYIGCSNIRTYSTELAEDNAGSVLEMNRFIILRLCPKDECSNYYKLGCNSGYGDYLIPMGDYLEIMSSTYFKQYVEYCQTCEACLHPDSSKSNSTGSSNGYYGWNEYASDGNSGSNCRYSGVCSKYRSACRDYSDQTHQLEDYFECSRVSMGESDAYLGPHCGSDGKSLGIGVYSDEYCNEYTNDLTEVSSNLGMDIDDSYLKPFHSNNCISCVASEGYVLDANQAGDGIKDVCYDIYGAAAKCNKYMGPDQDINTEVQEDNEETVCTFINNIMTNSYDEYGEIYLGRGGLGSLIRATSSFDGSPQWHVLAFSILLVSGLGAYAVYLHRALSRYKFAWLPRRGYSTDPKSDPALLGRNHSGIIAGRSFEKGGFR